MSDTTAFTPRILSSLLPSLSQADLLAKWQAGEWHLEQGDRRRFGNLFDIGALASAAECAKIAHKIAIFSSNPDDGGLLGVHDVKRDAVRFFAMGLTLQMGDLHEDVEEIAALTRALAHEVGVPRASIAARGLFSPPNTRTAYGWHFDCFDNIVVQLVGTKKWRLAKNVDVQWPVSSGHPASPAQGSDVGCISHSDLAFKALPLYPQHPSAFSYFPRQWNPHTFDRPTEIEMRPGSVLFSPRGLWHSTGAVGSEGSIALAFEFTPLPWYNVIAAALIGNLIRDPGWRRPAIGLVSPGVERGIALDSLHELLTDLRERLRDWTAEKCVEDLYWTLVHRGPERVQREERLYILNSRAKMTLSRSGVSRWLLRVRDAKSRHVMELDQQFLPLLTWIMETRTRPFSLACAMAAVPHVPVESGSALLSRLVASQLVRYAGKQGRNATRRRAKA
jgi:50S ribosomal protein L16 3-hydroxylase